jgi:hypothetical protein
VSCGLLCGGEVTLKRRRSKGFLKGRSKWLARQIIGNLNPTWEAGVITPWWVNLTVTIKGRSPTPNAGPRSCVDAQDRGSRREGTGSATVVAVRLGAAWLGVVGAVVAEPLAGFTDGGGVDDRQGFGDVVAQHTVEQGFVAILQRAEIDVFSEIVSASGEFMPAMSCLLFESLHGGRQQSKQTVLAALGLGESRAFCRQGVEQGGLPPLLVRRR